MFARFAFVVGFIVVTVTFGGGVMAQAMRITEGMAPSHVQMTNP